MGDATTAVSCAKSQLGQSHHLCDQADEGHLRGLLAQPESRMGAHLAQDGSPRGAQNWRTERVFPDPFCLLNGDGLEEVSCRLRLNEGSRESS
jgi:hypothetical protein